MGAEATAPQIIITFDGDQCIYNGPDSVPADDITVVLDVEDQTAYEEYGVAVVTLQEGKTFEDLDAWSSTSPPSWATVHTTIDQVPQGNHAEATMHVIEPNEPLYFVCFTAYPIVKSGTLGPIEIQ